MAEPKSWPAWRYGPGGESRIFQEGDVIPKGWENHPDKVKQPGKTREKKPVVTEKEPTPEEKAETIRSIREAAEADGIEIQLSDDASVDEINEAIDKLNAR